MSDFYKRRISRCRGRKFPLQDAYIPAFCAKTKFDTSDTCRTFRQISHVFQFFISVFISLSSALVWLCLSLLFLSFISLIIYLHLLLSEILKCRRKRGVRFTKWKRFALRTRFERSRVNCLNFSPAALSPVAAKLFYPETISALMKCQVSVGVTFATDGRTCLAIRDAGLAICTSRNIVQHCLRFSQNYFSKTVARFLEDSFPRKDRRQFRELLHSTLEREPQNLHRGSLNEERPSEMYHPGWDQPYPLNTMPINSSSPEQKTVALTRETRACN